MNHRTLTMTNLLNLTHTTACTGGTEFAQDSSLEGAVYCEPVSEIEILARWAN